MPVKPEENNVLKQCHAALGDITNSGININVTNSNLCIHFNQVCNEDGKTRWSCHAPKEKRRKKGICAAFKETLMNRFKRSPGSVNVPVQESGDCLMSQPSHDSQNSTAIQGSDECRSLSTNRPIDLSAPPSEKVNKLSKIAEDSSLGSLSLTSSPNNLITTDNNSMELQKESMFDSNSPELSQHTLVKPASTLPQENLNLNSQQENSGSTQICPLKDLSEDALLKKSSSYEDKNACVLHIRPLQPETLSGKSFSSGYPNITNTMYPESQCRESSNYESNPTSIQVCTKLEDYDSGCFKDLEERNKAAKAPDHSYDSSPSSPVLQVPVHLHLNEGMSFDSLNGEVDSDFSDSRAGLDNYRSDETFSRSIGIPSAGSDSLYQMNDETNLSVDNFVSELSVKDTTETFSVTEDSSEMEMPQHNLSDDIQLPAEMVGYKHDSSRIKSPQIHTSIATNLPVLMVISESETSNKAITYNDVSNDISSPDTSSEVIPPQSHAANITHPHDTCITVKCEFDKSTRETVQDNVADDVKGHNDTETSVPSLDGIGDNTLNEVCESVHIQTMLDDSVIAPDPIQEKSHQYSVTTDNTKQEMKKAEHVNVNIDLEADYTVKETEHKDKSVDMTLTDEVIESLPMSTTIEQSQHGVFGKTIMTEETVESMPVPSRTIVTFEPDASDNNISPKSVPVSSRIETLDDAVTSTDKPVHSEHISECLPVRNESLETVRHNEYDRMKLNKENETLRPECLMETTHGGSYAAHTQENQIDGSFSRNVICDISYNNVDSFEVIKERTSLSKTEKFSPSTLPTVISYHTLVDQSPEKKIVRRNKKKRKTRSKKSRNKMYQSGASDIVMSSMYDTSVCSTSLYNSSFSSDTPGTKIPPRQKHKLCPEVTSPPSDKSNIEQKLNDVQMSSNVIDSGIGASNDPPSCIGNKTVTEISIVKSPDGDLTRGNIGKVEIKTSEGALNIVQRADQFKKILDRVLLRMHRRRTKSLVRELHVGHRYIQLLQFGLGSYFDRLNNGPPPSLQEQMHYEWLRLASFQHYTGSGNAIHLARNGFYHRHTDGPVSTRCIYCDVTCNNWQYFDDIAARHRELSPQCPFHGGGQQPVNVSITGDEPQSTNASAAQASGASSNLVTMSSTSTTGPTITACPAKARSATSSAAVNDVTKQLATVTVSQARPNNTRINSAPAQPTEDPEGTTSRTFDTHRGTARHVPGRLATHNNENTTSQGARNQGAAGSGNFVDRTGTSGPPPAGPERDTLGQPLANVRHPQYSTMAQRIDTFQGFPDHLDQTPEQMALAGFYFVGVADFTRCFCCGGGLRNWEAGDDPLLEHTRWFPRCEYVRRLKGDSYVAAVQRRHQEHMEEQRREQLELANRNNASNTPAPDPMTTDAACVMCEMGYDDNKIRQTILAVRRQIGTHLITPQQVLSWLLDQDDSTTRTAPPPVNDENSVYAGIHMANNDSDNESFTTARQDSLTTTTSTTGITSTISTTTDTTRVRLTGTTAGSNNTMVTSSNTGNQSTSSPAAGAGGTTGASSMTGAKKNGGKKKKKIGRSAVGTGEGGQPSRGAVGGRTGPEAEAARKIQEENEKLRDMQTCKICMERLVNTTMLPCGHLIACDICASRLRDCPVCRTKIKGTVKTYLS